MVNYGIRATPYMELSMSQQVTRIAKLKKSSFKLLCLALRKQRQIIRKYYGEFQRILYFAFNMNKINKQVKCVPSS